jgi:myo-inositol-1(or 4)-monophosphatase
MSLRRTPPDARAEALDHALRVAGDAAMARFRSTTVRRKVDGSEVTDADLAAEEALVGALLEAFPGDGVRSEEGTIVEPAPGAGTWWVDPIDGTSAFVEGLAFWGPSAGRVPAAHTGDGRADGRGALGGFRVPRLDETYLGFEGGGAWRDGVRLPSAPPRSARRAVLLLPSGAHHVGPLPWPGKTRALGATAAHLALVAAGAADATVVGRWAPWDVAGGLVLAKEAGRAVVDLSGRPVDPMDHEPAPFLVGAPETLPHLLSALSKLDGRLRPLPSEP